MFRAHPLIFMTFLYAAGIGLAETFHLPILSLILFTGGLALLALLSMRWQMLATVILGLALVSLGCLRWTQQRIQVYDQALASVANYAQIWVAGKIEPPIEYQNKRCQFDFRLLAAAPHGTWQAARGKIRIHAPRAKQPYPMGEILLVRGRWLRALPGRNPGQFNQLRYFQTHGLQASLIVRQEGRVVPTGIRKEVGFISRTGAWQMQQRLQAIMQKRFARPALPILKGLLLGRRSSIGQETQTSFARTGVIHVLAVSGLHVGFVILIFMAVAAIFRIPRNWMIGLVLAGIWAYAWLTGLKPPVMRATLMATLFLVAYLQDRLTSTANLLALAALIILLIRPGELFQVGFQLSFSAVAGILYLYPKIERWVKATGWGARLFRFGLTRWVMGLLILSLVAQLGTLPFTLYHFHRVSLLALISNLFVIPAIFLTVATGFLALLISPISAGLSSIFATVTQTTILAVANFIHFLAQFRYAAIENIHIQSWQILLFYLIGLLIFEWHNRRRRAFLLLSVLLVLNLHVWAAVHRGSPKLMVMFLDVGQGDAALVRFPHGQTLLVDAGPAGFNFNAGKEIVFPVLQHLGIHRLDAVLITHPHLDHLGGLEEILPMIKIGQVIFADTGYIAKPFQNLLKKLHQFHINMSIARRGDVLTNFAPVQIWIMGPAPEDAKIQKALNNASLITQIRYGKTAFLLMGDTEAKGEGKVLAFGGLLKSAVLKAGHHGSATSTGPKFLQQVHPTWTILSLGAFNKFHHPSPVVTSRLAHAGSDTLRTDLLGAILFQSDGRQIRRIAWRSGPAGR
ncbi:MAG: DNA internalization-related competence protein ComEC/Rec2 [Calditrichaeota bacterium]|nr:MAG: DNA internalization-related competence protein ComEC/Rec2 [Calditrichota bacterium]